MPQYNSVPSLVQWQKDTAPSAANAKKEKELRPKDPILTRLDQIIDSYHKGATDGQKWFLITDMFFTSDYWLKRFSQKSSAALDPARQPAVYALFVASANWLCTLFNCTINVLPRELEIAFGREMGYHGSHIDAQPNVAKYMTRADVAKYRLLFRDGKVWQLPWWERNGKKIVPAESSRAKGTYNPAAKMTDPMFGKNYGGFVMSMGRDLYMAPHFGCYNKDNFFHSSYLAGNAVMCAGSMLIEGGQIKAIKNDSGHYRPTDLHIFNVLQALQMLGVNPAGIRIDAFMNGGWVSTDAPTLISASGDFSRITKGQAQFKQHLQARKLQKN